MARRMTWELITDSRVEGDNYMAKGKQLSDKIIARLGNMDGIELEYDCGRVIDFGECKQLRKRFYVSKNTRKITWNDIMHMVNEVKSAPYNWTNKERVR